MARWDFAVALDRNQRVPLFAQIAHALAADISGGRLRAGDPLPGTRSLARSLGVQRQTVVAAFDELMSEGWIVTRPARGTFVSPAVPEPAPRRFAAESKAPARPRRSPRFDLPPGPILASSYRVPAGALFFAPTRPDVRLAPAELIGRAYRRAIRQGGGALLSYTQPYGHARLRKAIAAMLSARRGVATAVENICITRGSQMALALVARALLRPGDLVAVEHLGYPPAWETFRVAGAHVTPVPLDAEGIQVDALDRLHRRRRLRAVYLTPHHQFPTTVTLSAGRRLRLLEFAARAKVAVIEDDFDHEFHYDGRPVMPLISADADGVVVYIGSLSKVLAPALRTGYVVGPSELIDRIAAHRALLDAQGDQVLEYALGELFEDGEIQRHIRRVRREYAARRDSLVGTLRKALGAALEFAVPAGGIAIWARATDGVDVEAWAAASSDAGAVAITARPFAHDGRTRPFFRLGFAALNTSELTEAVRRFASAHARLRAAGQRRL